MKKILFLVIAVVLIAGCAQQPTGQFATCSKCSDASAVTEAYESVLKERESLMDKTLEFVSYYTIGASSCKSKLIIRNARILYNGHIAVDYYNPGNETKLEDIYADDINDNMPSTEAYIGAGSRCLEKTIINHTAIGEKDRTLDLTEACDLTDMEKDHIVSICILTPEPSSRQACLIERMKSA